MDIRQQDQGTFNDWEPTNAPFLMIETKNGLLGIDPFDETFIEAKKVAHLWKGRTDIRALHSQGAGGSFLFVSIDWLIKIHPKEIWLQTVAVAIRKRIQTDGFEADEE
jgi:hypothetical protein